jgi:hypothetical protein
MLWFLLYMSDIIYYIYTNNMVNFFIHMQLQSIILQLRKKLYRNDSQTKLFYGNLNGSSSILIRYVDNL